MEAYQTEQALPEIGIKTKQEGQTFSVDELKASQPQNYSDKKQAGPSSLEDQGDANTTGPLAMSEGMIEMMQTVSCDRQKILDADQHSISSFARARKMIRMPKL
jgi:hypothetical protein